MKPQFGSWNRFYRRQVLAALTVALLVLGAVNSRAQVLYGSIVGAVTDDIGRRRCPGPR